MVVKNDNIINKYKVKIKILQFTKLNKSNKANLNANKASKIYSTLTSKSQEKNWQWQTDVKNPSKIYIQIYEKNLMQRSKIHK